MISTLTGVLFLSTLIEGLITYIAGERSEIDKPRNYLKYISLALGILLAIGYNIRLTEWIGFSSTFPAVDYIISGIVIARGSNYVNDTIGRFRKKE